MPKLAVTPRHISHICNRLAAFGEEAYDRASDGHHDVRTPFPSPDISPSLSDLYERHTRGRRPLDPKIEDDLNDAGFSAFSTLGYGTTTWVYTAHHDEGHDYALRISFKVKERRHHTPLVVQAYRAWEQPGLIVDVTPIVQVLTLEDSSVPMAQMTQTLDDTDDFILDHVIRRAMAVASCESETPHPCKDIGILPDGTPIQPDPGQIQYRNGTDIPAALEAFRQSASVLPQLQWFSGERFKQDRFFIDPFRRPVYKPGLTLA